MPDQSISEPWTTFLTGVGGGAEGVTAGGAQLYIGYACRLRVVQRRPIAHTLAVRSSLFLVPSPPKQASIAVVLASKVLG